MKYVREINPPQETSLTHKSVYPSLRPDTVPHLRTLIKHDPNPTPGILRIWADRLEANVEDVERWISIEQEKHKVVFFLTSSLSQCTDNYTAREGKSRRGNYFTPSSDSWAYSITRASLTLIRSKLKSRWAPKIGVCKYYKQCAMLSSPSTSAGVHTKFTRRVPQVFWTTRTKYAIISEQDPRRRIRISWSHRIRYPTNALDHLCTIPTR